MILNQKKVYFEPRIKLNHSIYNYKEGKSTNLWCTVLGDPIRWNGGLTERNGGTHAIFQNTEYTEYTKTRNLQNFLYLIRIGLTKKAEAKNTRLF